MGSSGPVDTELEALQGWLLKVGGGSTRLSTSIEIFVDWLANGSLPWAAYCAFMSGQIIAIDKNPGVRPVGVKETLQRLFAKIVLKVKGTEATKACQDDQMFSRLKAGINNAINGVQAQ